MSVVLLLALTQLLFQLSGSFQTAAIFTLWNPYSRFRGAGGGETVHKELFVCTNLYVGYLKH